jgi:hypothetical protein
MSFVSLPLHIVVQHLLASIEAHASNVLADL